jgi:hypothetical protein
MIHLPYAVRNCAGAAQYAPELSPGRQKGSSSDSLGFWRIGRIYWAFWRLQLLQSRAQFGAALQRAYWLGPRMICHLCLSYRCDLTGANQPFSVRILVKPNALFKFRVQRGPYT